MDPKTRTRIDREAALAANAKSPVRTLVALHCLSERELVNLEAEVARREREDPYAMATKRAPRVAQSSDDPSYAPFGAAPDGYAIHLTEADNKKENR